MKHLVAIIGVVAGFLVAWLAWENWKVPDYPREPKFSNVTLTNALRGSGYSSVNSTPEGWPANVTMNMPDGKRWMYTDATIPYVQIRATGMIVKCEPRWFEIKERDER